MKIKIIDKYITRDLVKVFLISVGTLTMVLYLDKFLFMAEMIVNRGVSFFELFQIMFYISPSFLALTFPMSVLVSSTVVFNQFSAFNEWTAMKACHLSFLQAMKPVLFFSILAYIFASSIMIYALPWGNLAYKQVIYDIIKNRVNIDIKSNIFNYDFKNLVLLAKDRDGPSRLVNVFIADSTQSKRPIIINANQAYIIPDSQSLKIKLELKNGTIHELSNTKSDYQTTNFETYDLTLSLPDTERLEKDAMVGNRELSIKKLLNQIDEFKGKGLPTNGVKVELSKKFSIPFTCLLFGLLGAPLGIHSSRSGKSGSFAMCISVIFLYYVGLIFMQNMGRSGEIEPYSSVWVPNLILLIIIIFLSNKMQKDLPFIFTNWSIDRAAIIFDFFRKLYLQIYPPTQQQTIQPLKYGRDRKEIDSVKKKIMKDKIKDIKSNYF